MTINISQEEVENIILDYILSSYSVILDIKTTKEIEWNDYSLSLSDGLTFSKKRK